MLTCRSASKGYRHELKTESDHETLLHTLRCLRGHVVLSGYASDAYTRLLPGWHAVPIRGGRDQQNATREEVCWLNFQPQPSLFDLTA